MFELDNTRQLALAANDECRGKNFCKSAECCTSIVPITPNDISRLKDAIEKKRIPEGVVNAIIKNASNTNRTQCPMLGKTGRCMAYNDRPDICVLWGAGGRPRSNDKVMFETARAVMLKEEPVFGTRDLECFSCPGCIKKANKDEIFPLRTIMKATQAFDRIKSREVSTTGEFAQTLLP